MVKHMTRGFITIATGKRHYYEIAANLVKSYRLFSDNPLPFAIIAEEKNEYTELFDDVIITVESTHSFMDKFLLLKLCPYDETIFIDADSLCFDNLNKYFDLFDNATDFSAPGVNVPRDSKEGAWYNVKDVEPYGSKLPYKCRVHAGVLFIRKSEKLAKLYDDCVDIYNNYDKLHFHTCKTSCDEATFGIAMPLNNMKTIREDPKLLAAYPCLTYLHADILHGILSYSTDWAGHIEHGTLLHFGTFHTHEPLYKFNIECLEFILNHPDKKYSLIQKILYEKKLQYWLLKIPYEIKRFIRRIINKLLRQHKDI